MKTGLIISRKSDLYSIQRLLSEAKNLDLNLIVASPLQILGKEISLSEIEFAIPRFGTFELQESLTALRVIEESGIFCLNQSLQIELTKDKWQFYNFCVENKISTPKTQTSSSGFHFPFIAKKRWGSKGEGVFLLNNPRELETLGTTEGSLIFQEFITECRGVDLRVLFLDGKCIGQYLRQSRSEDFRSNLAQGGTPEYIELSKEVEQLVLQTAKLLPQLRLIGFDFLLSHRGPLLLEANSSPGFEGLESQTSINVAAEILKVCIRK